MTSVFLPERALSTITSVRVNANQIKGANNIMKMALKLTSKTTPQALWHSSAICGPHSENCSYRQLKQKHQWAAHPREQYKNQKTAPAPICPRTQKSVLCCRAGVVEINGSWALASQVYIWTASFQKNWVGGRHQVRVGEAIFLPAWVADWSLI